MCGISDGLACTHLPGMIVVEMCADIQFVMMEIDAEGFVEGFDCLLTEFLVQSGNTNPDVHKTGWPKTLQAHCANVACRP